MEMIPLDDSKRGSIDWKKRARKIIHNAWKDLQKMPHKAELKMECPLDHFLAICKDPYYATLSQWDMNNIRPRSHVLETDEIVCDTNLFIHQRQYISWWAYNMKRNSYSVIHCTLNNQGELESYEGYWFVVLKSGRIFVQTNQSIERLHYLETMASKDETMDVFSNWTCSHCQVYVSSSRLDCTKCRRARYWACENPECEWPQAEKDKRCRKCKYIKMSV